MKYAQRLISFLLSWVLVFYLAFSDNNENVNQKQIKEATLAMLENQIYSNIKKLSGIVRQEQMQDLLGLIEKFLIYKEAADDILKANNNCETETELDANIIFIYNEYNHFLPSDKDGKIAILLTEISGQKINFVDKQGKEIFYKVLLTLLFLFLASMAAFDDNFFLLLGLFFLTAFFVMIFLMIFF